MTDLILRPYQDISISALRDGFQQGNKKNGFVYLIHTEDMSHFYIGSTANTKKRFKHHSFEMRKGTHHSDLLQKACNKYGFDYFKFSVLMEFETRKESELAEQSLLDRFYKQKGCLNCSSVAIMAAQCPDVIARRNETLRSESHRENARAKNKDWFLNNQDAAKEILRKSAETRSLPEARKANSDRQKLLNLDPKRKEAFALRIKKHRDAGGKTAAKKTVRIDDLGNEIIFNSAAEASRNTPNSDFRGISACCNKVFNSTC